MIRPFCVPVCLLLFIVTWFDRLRKVLDQGSPSQWTGNDYWNVFFLIAVTCAIFVFWNSWTTKPTTETGEPKASQESDEI